MEFLKTRQQIVTDKTSLVSEGATRTADGYRVIASIDVPKSLINAFCSKAKKENNIDPRETLGETLLAEMLVNYMAANFMNIESFPITAVMGEKPTTEVQTDIQPAEITQPIVPNPEIVQPGAQTTQSVQTPGEPSTEIQATV